MKRIILSFLLIFFGSHSWACMDMRALPQPVSVAKAPENPEFKLCDSTGLTCFELKGNNSNILEISITRDGGKTWKKTSYDYVYGLELSDFKCDSGAKSCFASGKIMYLGHIWHNWGIIVGTYDNGDSWYTFIHPDEGSSFNTISVSKCAWRILGDYWGTTIVAESYDAGKCWEIRTTR